MLTKLLEEHYTKQRSKDPVLSTKKHLQRALKEEAYMAFTIDLLAKGDDTSKKPTEEEREKIK